MSWIFETVDKTGRLIHLSRIQWFHVQKHPGMTVYTVERMKETLTRPDKIIPFEADPYLCFYFRYYRDRKEYLFLLVKYLNGEGFIITSFYTDKTQ